MPGYYPATDPADLPSGPVGSMSRLEYIALILNGQVGHPSIHSANPGRIDDSAALPVLHTLLGREMIPVGWKQASRIVILPTPIVNTAIEWTAVQPGEGGNVIHIEYVNNGGATAVDWNPGTSTVTVGLNIAGAGDTAANVIIALAASVTGAQAVVQARNAVGSTGAGTIDEAYASALLTGGTGLAFQRAILQIGPGGAGNNAIIYRARKPGVGGNAITIAYVAGLGSNILPVVTVTGNAISVSIDVGVTTAASVLRALWASAAAMALVSARSAYVDTALGFPAAVGATNLAGGADGPAVSANVAGMACPVTTVTQESVVVSVPALTGSVPTDAARMEINICGFRHELWMPVF